MSDSPSRLGDFDHAGDDTVVPFHVNELDARGRAVQLGPIHVAHPKVKLILPPGYRSLAEVLMDRGGNRFSVRHRTHRHLAGTHRTAAGKNPANAGFEGFAVNVNSGPGAFQIAHTQVVRFYPTGRQNNGIKLPSQFFKGNLLTQSGVHPEFRSQARDNPDFGIQGVVRGFGWESFTFDPLYNADIVIYGILIAGLWQGTGLIMCLMLAGLRGIDEDIWKAARVDGIPMWKTYLFIVVPMMRPVFITTLVIIASGIVRVYDLVVAQTSGGPGHASEVPAKYVYDYMFAAQNLGQGFAASTMMLLSVVIVVVPWTYLEFGGRGRRV